MVTRLISNNAGIAVGYIDKQTNEMIYNPDANVIPEIKALVAICKDDNMFSNEDVKAFVL